MYIQIDTTKRAGTIELGVQGENAAEGVDFDVTSWIEEYGSGTPFIYIKRRGDEAPYFKALDITTEDDVKKARWTFDDVDTAVKGDGECQLVFTVGAVMVKKTEVYVTSTKRSLGDASGDIPDPYEDLLEQAREIMQETVEQASAAAVSAENALASETAAQEAAEDAAESAVEAANVFKIAGNASISMDPDTRKLTLHISETE